MNRGQKTAVKRKHVLVASPHRGRASILPSSAGTHRPELPDVPVSLHILRREPPWKDPCGVTGRNLALLQTPSDLSQAKTGSSEANLCEVQVPGSGNPTCECSGLRTSFGHPHQAPLTRSSHQTSSSRIYPSHLLCGFLPTPVCRIPRIIKNSQRDFPGGQGVKNPLRRGMLDPWQVN